MSKKPSGKSAKTQSKATEKARRDAIAATQANLERIDAGLDHEVPSAKEVANNANVEAAVEAKKTKGEKPPKPPKAPKEPKPKKVSALDAAAQVLVKSDQPMTSKALIDAMAKAKLWTSPGGKTPEATLYAAMVREITAKGKDARFKKADRGLFVANA